MQNKLFWKKSTPFPSYKIIFNVLKINGSNNVDNICIKISLTIHLRLTSYLHIEKEFGGPGFEF